MLRRRTPTYTSKTVRVEMRDHGRLRILVRKVDDDGGRYYSVYADQPKNLYAPDGMFCERRLRDALARIDESWPRDRYPLDSVSKGR